MRQYLPTLGDLLDRLSIVQQKMVFSPEHSKEYLSEAQLIIHDITELLADKTLDGKFCAAVLGLMLANRFIWANEEKVRAGGKENSGLLFVTHSINAIRTVMKNYLSSSVGEREEVKADCLAAELPEEVGNWRILLRSLDKEG